MHYTGTIWRPPYEAGSLLIEVTSGCTHHACKFCTLYHDLPFRFRMSPLEDIEADLQEAREALRAWKSGRVERVFLVGANPFVLQVSRLREIARLVHTYFPACASIGCFARVTDITPKTDDELRELRSLGFDGLTIGVESGDDEALTFMNKGYHAADIIDQTQRLDRAGISYSFFYLAGIAGAGRGEEGAAESAKVFNLTHPRLIGSSMLTVYPESGLAGEIEAGNWEPEGELEKYREVRALVERLELPTVFAMLGASNAIPLQGTLPRDREKLLAALDGIIATVDEDRLRAYRDNLPHL